MLGIFYASIFIFFFFGKIKNDLNLVCQNKKPENDENENNGDKKELDDYIPNFKMYFSMNKYKIRSYSFKNLEKTNNPRISLYTSITE